MSQQTHKGVFMGSKTENRVNVNPLGGVYFLGMIGAAVYYFSVAHGFGGGVVALLKAFVWPAFLVHDVLRYIA